MDPTNSGNSINTLAIMCSYCLYSKCKWSRTSCSAGQRRQRYLFSWHRRPLTLSAPSSLLAGAHLWRRRFGFFYEGSEPDVCPASAHGPGWSWSLALIVISPFRALISSTLTVSLCTTVVAFGLLMCGTNLMCQAVAVDNGEEAGINVDMLCPLFQDMSEMVAQGCL